MLLFFLFQSCRLDLDPSELWSIKSNIFAHCSWAFLSSQVYAGVSHINTLNIIGIGWKESMLCAPTLTSKSVFFCHLRWSHVVLGNGKLQHEKKKNKKTYYAYIKIQDPKTSWHNQIVRQVIYLFVNTWPYPILMSSSSPWMHAPWLCGINGVQSPSE